MATTANNPRLRAFGGGMDQEGQGTVIRGNPALADPTSHRELGRQVRCRPFGKRP